MLENAGVTLDAVRARVDEYMIKQSMLVDGAPPRDIADKLAELKAMRVSSQYPGQLVLGADQVLVHDGVIFDKPPDLDAARAQLLQLRGKTHQLISAVVFYQDNQAQARFVQTAQLSMRPFSDEFVDAYIEAEGDALLTTVGSYRLEGLGAQLFTRVQGDYFTVLGLPLLDVLNYLRVKRILIE